MFDVSFVRVWRSGFVDYGLEGLGVGLEQCFWRDARHSSSYRTVTVLESLVVTAEATSNNGIATSNEGITTSS